MTALDDALDELRQHAKRIGPHDPHHPGQCACGGMPASPGQPRRHIGSCDGMSRGDRIARVLELLALLDENACDGDVPDAWRQHHHDPVGFCFPGCPRWQSGTSYVPAAAHDHGGQE